MATTADLFSDEEESTSQSSLPSVSMTKTTADKRNSRRHKPKTLAKRRMLTKTQRSKVKDVVESEPIDDIIKSVERQFQKEMVSRDLGLSDIISTVVSDMSLLTSLVNYHLNSFGYLYEKCDTGKEKFLRFQVEWHKRCSCLLLPKDVDVTSVSPDIYWDEASVDVRKKWEEFCEPHSFEKCKNVMILFSSFMYNIISEQILSVTTSDTLHVCTNEVEQLPTDGDDVYHRLGGATLCSMLHVRYNATRKSNSKETCLSKEISILSSLNTRDKSEMPEYLQYRDHGYMYAPNPCLIPFLRDVDSTVREVVNPAGFNQHTSDLVKVAHTLVKTKSWLKEKFIKVVNERCTGQEISDRAKDKVYDDMVRKLCNIRIEEFLSSQKQNFASQKGNASMNGQNLRDSLLAQHANLRTRSKVK